MKVKSSRDERLVINRDQAIKVFFMAVDHEDPYWGNLMDDYYDEKTDSFPTQRAVGRALGFTDLEMEIADGMTPGRLKGLGL